MKRGVILIPFRDRAEHLKSFLAHYPTLVPHMDIVVCEQADTKPFNRAKLFNAAFLEMGYQYDFACYHDVDMLAEDNSGYEFYDYPVHLASAAEQFGWSNPYPEFYGGVTNIPTHVMHTVNGFSNLFFSRQGEDDHMYKRLLANDIKPHRLDGKRYKCFEHPRHVDQKLYKQNLKILNAPNDPTDGLSSCVYEVVDVNTITEGYVDPVNGWIVESNYLHIKVIL